MVKVRAVRAHNNRYGLKYRKAVGDEYKVPESMADSLRSHGLVELADWSPPENFLDRSVSAIAVDLQGLDAAQLVRLRADEEAGKTRKSLIAAIDARIAALAVAETEAAAE